jgi:hypothetical protein
VTQEKRIYYRLAFREEGDRVVCYYALPDTMEGALELSSMRLGIMQRVPQLFPQWQQLMQTVMDHANREILGIENPAEWEFTPAPEHERAGKA